MRGTLSVLAAISKDIATDIRSGGLRVRGTLNIASEFAF